MADVVPFRAYRYADRLAGSLPRLVCPPYDVISKAERKKILKRHPSNFVRVELPAGGPGKYAAAARLWERWMDGRVLERETFPALYLYEAAFRSRRTGRLLRRRGFFAALRTVAWGRGVFPHEKTLPTHKADRMKLFKAMNVQTSPIQCVFDDSGGRAAKVLSAAARRAPWVDFQDEAGVRHKLWRLDDPVSQKTLLSVLKRAAVVIADGHHRYETARAFGLWARKKWKSGSPASNHVMTYFCPVDDPGLEILPTHRTVGWDKRRFVNLEKWGKLKPVKGLRALQNFIEGKAKNGTVGVYRKGSYYLYTLTSAPPELRGTPSERLAVAGLHAGQLKGLGKEDFFFTQSPREAVEAARRQNGWAFFLAPTGLRQVLEVARRGQVMPPKSTYFYPKLPSGLLSHSLKGSL
jgi:uncharacterized protein (DUF1015 family)